MILSFIMSFILCLGSALYTVPPTWITSNLVRADNRNIIATKTGSNTTPTYTFTFSSPLSGTPFLGYGIKAYEGSDYFGQEYFEVNRTNLDATSFRVAVQILGVTNILLMNVPYIAIDPSFPHHINSFDNVPINYTYGPLVNISTSSTTVQTFTNTINYTLQATGLTYKTFQTPLTRNKVLLFLTSLFIAGALQSNVAPYNPLNLSVSSSVVSTSQYKLSVDVSIKVSVTKLHFSIVVFDQVDVQSSGTYMLVYNTINLPYTGGMIPIPIQFISNFIMGILDFSTNKTQTILDFQWDFKTVNGVHGAFMPQSVGQSNSTMGIQTINRITYTLFYMKTWFCPNLTLFDPSQDLCTQCPVSNCLTCNNITTCTICDNINNYILNTTTMLCQLIQNNTINNMTNNSTNNITNNSTNNTNNTNNGSNCGNGIIQTGQQCDDGNIVSYDGCSSLCQSQTLYKCKITNPCTSTFAILEDSFKLDRSTCNRFYLTFKTNSIGFLNNVQQVYFINQGLQIINRSVTGDVFKIEVQYDRDIYNETLELFVPFTSFYLRVDHNQGIPLLKYYQNECETVDYLHSTIQGINVISYIVLFISLFSSKIIGLELFGLLQLAYFSLAQHDFLNLYLSPLTSFQATNGLNVPFFSQSSSILPPNLRAMKISTNFINNCNIMVILMFSQLLISAALYLMSKKLKSKKMKKVSQILLKQGFITLAMFNIFNISFSAGIHFKYSNSSDQASIFSSILAVSSLLTTTIAAICIQLLKQKRYGQFKSKFKQNCVCRAYIPLSILYRMVLGLYIGTKNEYSQTTLLILSVSFVYILFNVTNLPFKSTFHNYRSNIIHITQLIILLCANYYRSMKINTPMQIKGHIYEPVIILYIMIILCVVISTTAVIVQAGTKLKKFLNKSEIKNQHVQIRNYTINETANNF